MSRTVQIPPRVGLVGSVVCSLIIAFEFGLGFHLRDLGLNVALGLALLLVMGFAVFSYRPYGVLALLALPLAIYVSTSTTWQILVGCSVRGACP